MKHFLGAVFALSFSAFTSAQSIQNTLGVEYYVKGYPNSEAANYFPRGVGLHLERPSFFIPEIGISARYRFLTTELKNTLGSEAYDSVIHQAGAIVTYDLLKKESSTIEILVDSEFELEVIESSSTESFQDYTILVGLQLSSAHSQRSRTNGTIAYRHSSIGSYDGDVVGIADWDIHITDKLFVTPMMQTNLDFNDFSASISVNYLW